MHVGHEKSPQFSVARLRGVICVTAFLSLGYQFAAAQEEAPKQEAKPKSLYGWSAAGISDFELTDQNGEKVTLKTLKGKPWVAGFIFTRCKGPCPNVVAQMAKLRKETNTMMVCFTVDPKVDTSGVLKAFSTDYVGKPNPEIDDKAPWYWLTGDQNKIYGMIAKDFRMPVKELFGPDRQPGFEILHSTNLMHVDENGVVLGKYNATEDADMALLRRILLGKAPRGKMMSGQSTPPPEDGEKLDPESVVSNAPPGLSFYRPATSETEEEEETGPPSPKKAPEESVEKNPPSPNVPDWVRRLPLINASLNGLATVLLLAGYLVIKVGKARNAHRNLMLASFGTSVVFLGCYLVYHYFQLTKHFSGSGVAKIVYFAILITHVILAAAVPFLATMTIYHAFRENWAKHLRLARVTFPIWLYVSVTGVIIYLMLYHWPTGVGAGG